MNRIWTRHCTVPDNIDARDVTLKIFGGINKVVHHVFDQVLK